MIDARTRRALLALRAALIMVLGAIEDVLEIERSIPTREERRTQRAHARAESLTDRV